MMFSLSVNLYKVYPKDLPWAQSYSISMLCSATCCKWAWN